jgi:hypothetical protein
MLRRWVESASRGPVVRRALASALVVGPVLVALNHGDAILSGDVSPGRLLRIALTVLVPYAVSTFSSVQATKTGIGTDARLRANERRQPSGVAS